MIGDQPGGAARDVSLWARIWAWWKAWRRPRKHFFVNTRVTIFFGLVFMLDIRLIVALLIIAATLDSYTFLAGQDRAKGEAEIPFWLSLKPAMYVWAALAILIPLAAPLFQNACLPANSVWTELFGFALWTVERSGGLCAYTYSTYMFFVEALFSMAIIIYFYFSNFIAQRNIRSIFFKIYEKQEIKGIIEAEKKTKIINPFIAAAFFMLPLYLPYGDPVNPGRMPNPHSSFAGLVFYPILILFSPVFGITIYFRTYGWWRLP